jgi:hypothetical protein
VGINDWTWAVASSSGSRGHSSSVSVRFANPTYVTAQAAISGVGGTDPTAEVGFSGWVDRGQWTQAGHDGYGTWASFVALEHVTQIDFSARTYDAWVNGSAVFYIWS